MLRYIPPYEDKFDNENRSSVRNNEEGYWNFWDLYYSGSTVPSHEVWHFLGLGDLYYEAGRTTWVSNKEEDEAHRGQMMGRPNTGSWLPNYVERNVSEYEVDLFLDIQKGTIGECNSQCCKYYMFVFCGHAD